MNSDQVSPITPTPRSRHAAAHTANTERLVRSAPRELPLCAQAGGSVFDAGWEPMPCAIPELAAVEPGAARIRRVADSDFPRLPVPEQFGGLGVRLAGVAAAQRELAR